MIPIKFRAWSPENKTMYPVTELKWEKDMLLWYGPGPDHQCRGGSVLMQFTGLKDKNGVEIYEGDVLSRLPEDGPNGKVFRQVVEWEHAKEKYEDIEGDILICGFYLDATFFYTLEVIGNIHQHPELLEVK